MRRENRTATLRWYSALCMFLASAGCDKSSTPADVLLNEIPKAPVVEKPNVVIFLADTLRADYLGCYGFPLDISPAIDAFAETGYLFSNAFAQSSWTKPSVASMFTGYLPSVHKAVIADDWTNDDQESVQVLRDSFVTLAEQFKASGYTTAMFTMNTHCQKEFGFAQGFDHYRYIHFEDTDVQMNAVLEWLENESDTPFFLYVHVRDPHHPYHPPSEDYDALYNDTTPISDTDRRILARFEQVYRDWAAGRASRDGLKFDDISPQGVEQLRRLYAAEVHYMDAQFKRLIDDLSALGIREQTTIAFVSDHGEEFMEHGSFGHGRTLYDELIHVPLIISPAGLHEKVRVPWNVRMFDLFPTLLTLAGLDVPDGLQARSLFKPNGALVSYEDRPVVSETNLTHLDHKEWTVSMIDGNEKIIVDRSTGEIQIFNRFYDREEAHQLSLPRFGRTRSRWNRLGKIIKENDALSERFGPAEWTVLDAETEEQLRNLGYIH